MMKKKGGVVARSVEVSGQDSMDSATMSPIEVT